MFSLVCLCVMAFLMALYVEAMEAPKHMRLIIMTTFFISAVVAGIAIGRVS